jgi:uncharacterized protein
MGVSSGSLFFPATGLASRRRIENNTAFLHSGVVGFMFSCRAVFFALAVFTTCGATAVDLPCSATSEATATLSTEILTAARTMTALGTRYKMSYPRIAYPGGDVDPHEGLCCDVVVRALRATGIDLQELVYEDYKTEPGPYRRARMGPFQGGIDRSWAHRRTALLDVFFSRKAVQLPTKYSSRTAADWKPGDIVIFKRNGWETWHIALISDATAPRTAEPMLIDAWLDPGKVSETHTLTSYGTIGGHYRIPDALREELPVEHKHRAKKAWADYEEALRVTRIATGSNRPETLGRRASGG